MIKIGVGFSRIFDVGWVCLFVDWLLFDPEFIDGYVVGGVVEGSVIWGQEEGVVYFGSWCEIEEYFSEKAVHRLLLFLANINHFVLFLPYGVRKIMDSFVEAVDKSKNAYRAAEQKRVKTDADSSQSIRSPAATPHSHNFNIVQWRFFVEDTGGNSVDIQKIEGQEDTVNDLQYILDRSYVFFGLWLEVQKNISGI